MIASFKPIYNSDSKILILGTIPGGDSLKNGRYYDSNKNHFWDIVYRSLNPNWKSNSCVQLCESYESKVKLLLDNNICLWDVIKSCEREGNRDSNIMNVTMNDFDQFFNEHKKIKKVIFNGKSAFNYFEKSFNTILLSDIFKYKVLNSTSSSNTKNTFIVLGEWYKELNEL